MMMQPLSVACLKLGLLVDGWIDKSTTYHLDLTLDSLSTYSSMRRLLFGQFCQFKDLSLQRTAAQFILPMHVLL